MFGQIIWTAHKYLLNNHEYEISLYIVLIRRHSAFSLHHNYITNHPRLVQMMCVPHMMLNELDKSSCRLEKPES